MEKMPSFETKPQFKIDIAKGSPPLEVQLAGSNIQCARIRFRDPAKKVDLFFVVKAMEALLGTNLSDKMGNDYNLDTGTMSVYVPLTGQGKDKLTLAKLKALLDPARLEAETERIKKELEA